MSQAERRLYICDTETVYLKRLTLYLNRHSDFLWHIRFSTSLSECLKAGPDALLVSGRILESIEDPEAFWKQTASMSGRVILLKDDSQNNYDGPFIEKYQSAKKVYEALLSLLEDGKTANAEIIGLYGPDIGPRLEEECLKVVGQLEGVLIVSLTEYSTFGKRNREGCGLGEWFYYQEQGREGNGLLNDCIYTEGSMDYVRGFHTVYDMFEIQLESWKQFYDEIRYKSRYKQVYILFDRLPPHLELFLWCDSIRVHWGEDGFGDVRREEFERISDYMGIQGLLNKMTEI